MAERSNQFQIKTVWIIEDDKSIRDVLVQVLRASGFPAQSFQNGKECLDFLASAHPEAPRMIFLDLMMPVMDGWQFLAARRKYRELEGVPVVAMTAFNHCEKPEGALSLLRKPIEIDEVLQTVEECSALCA